MSSLRSHSQLAPSPAGSPGGPRHGRFSNVSTDAWGAVAVGLVAACAIALWQSADSRDTSHRAASAPTGPPLSLSERVLTSDAIPGMVAMATPTVVRSASTWAVAVEQSPSPPRETARLRSLGYVAGAVQQLHGATVTEPPDGLAAQHLGGVGQELGGGYPVAAEGVSLVEQFRSPAGAQAELAYQSTRLARTTGARTATFASGIPDAHGTSLTAPGTAAQNLMFAEGRYYYLVGTGGPTGGHGLPTRAELTSAVGFLYLSINACVAREPRPRAL